MHNAQRLGGGGADAASVGEGMARRLKLGQLLISKGLLAPEQLASALAEQEQRGCRLGLTLVRLGYIEEDLLVKVLSRQLQLPVARVGGKRVKSEILERVPVELAEIVVSGEAAGVQRWALEAGLQVATVAVHGG